MRGQLSRSSLVPDSGPLRYYHYMRVVGKVRVELSDGKRSLSAREVDKGLFVIGRDLRRG